MSSFRPRRVIATFKASLTFGLNFRQFLALSTAALILFQPTVLVAQHLRMAEGRNATPKVKVGGPLAGVSLTTLGVASTQNFDTLISSGSTTWTNDSTIGGWFHARTGTGTTIVANNGSSNAGNLYSYGTGTDAERALGSLGSGNAAIGNLFWGVRLQNNTGSTITQLDVTYTGEQWRNSAAAAQTVAFSYLVGSPTVTGSLAEFQSAGVAVPQLDFTSPITGGAAGALDGNLAANRVTLTHSITGLNIPNGTEVMLRWADPDHTGADHGLSIDNFSVTPQGAAPGLTLSINDVSQDEGNAGTTVFTFTVSLSSSTHGGVTFDIGTADGTAQDGSAMGEDTDYVAKALGGQTIPNGSDSYQFTVDVNGDTANEPNETFAVNVVNVTGATVADGQGQGTIQNDDIAVTPIHDIQGNGTASPLTGQVVTTTGIVTLLRTSSNAGGGVASGFFIQEPDATVDADPNTSEGIFVFTSSVPSVSVGDGVRVTGTATEFNGLTEISPVTNVTVLSTGNTLPTAVALTAVILDSTAAPTQPQLEKYECMRMSGTLTTVAPNNNFYEVDAVLSSVTRPMREPGIPVSDPIPPDPTSGTPDPNIPIWDENPERISVDTNGRAGTPNVGYTSNVTFTNVSGPIDFAFGRYRIIPDATLSASANLTATAIPTPLASEFTIASYNIENFNNSATQRVKAALTICNVLHQPDIIGTVEIFDLADLQALATEVQTVCGATYSAHLIEQDGTSEDSDQDVGFLVKTSRVSVTSVTQEREEVTYAEPGGGDPAAILHDRPPLLLDAIVDPAGANPRRVLVVVNHLRSFIDIELVAGDGPRVREKRKKQAEDLGDLLNDLQTANPGVPVISVGDYNAYQFNSGYDDSLSVLKGSPTADDQIVVDQSPDVVEPNFTNITENVPAAERYSFVFEGTPQALDHHLVSTAALARNTGIAIARVNSDFPEAPAATYATNVAIPERNSDHDPVVSYYTLLDPATAGQLVISEFRVRGPNPNGAQNEFIEIYNASGADHTVAGAGSGYAIAASDGVARCVIPNGTVIPNRGHFLCTNSVGYSLSGYAAGDASYTTDIPDNAGIALFNTSVAANFTLANRLDAVGSTSEANTLYKEGTGYPALTPFSIDYSFVRDNCGKQGSITTLGGCPSGGFPVDTNNNATDFYFVDTNGTSAGAGQRLGAPGPEDLASPIQRNSVFGVVLLDGTIAPQVSPNRVRDFTSDPANNSTFGTLEIRRRVVNNTGGSVTRLRFRIVDLTTFPAPSGFADLRPRTSSLAVISGINDSSTCLASNGVATTPCTINVQGTTLEQPPSQLNGGGFNSSMSAGTITLGTPLANGASINLRFLLGIQQTGTFKFYFNVEALP